MGILGYVGLRVKELHLGDYVGEAILTNLYAHYGDFSKVS